MLLLLWSGPAQILEEPQSQNVTGGGRLELICNVTGRPPPAVIWEKEGGVLVLDHRVQVIITHPCVRGR